MRAIVFFAAVYANKKKKAKEKRSNHRNSFGDG
jgi:hypothetical protein